MASGLERVEASINLEFTDPTFALTAQCPSDKVIIGGGATIHFGGGHVALSYPRNTTGWHAEARQTTGRGIFVVHAICANAS